jgi:hypothetical protein
VQFGPRFKRKICPCARATNGQAAAAPPRRVMKLRRRMTSPPAWNLPYPHGTYRCDKRESRLARRSRSKRDFAEGRTRAGKRKA